MFGLSDTTTHTNDDATMLSNVKQLAQEPAANITPTLPTNYATPATNGFIGTAQTVTPTPAPVNPAPATDTYQFTAPPTPSEPTATTQSIPTQPIVAQPVATPSDDSKTAQDTLTTPQTTSLDHEQLASLKQEALTHLESLQDHLDGTPEEVFKTTMMMIQANDNHTLLQKALEAAKKIKDDKERAQAMLDIINEINYFAQNAQVE